MAEEKIPRLFGTNGVRGVINSTIDAQFASRMGLAFATSLHQRFGWARVKIGTDTRISSEMLKSATISGLLSGGAEVVDIGVCPSPAIQHAVGTDDKCNGGVIITASHNPPQFNGIKCISADGTEMARDEEERIEKLFFLEINGADWTDTGLFSVDGGANEAYMDAIFSHADVRAIKKKHFTVITDCSNGAACHTSPYIFERLGCRVISLNCHPDGTFPGHMSEPTAENLKNTGEVVRALSADMGFAHDGDADRTVFMDENGRYVHGNISLAIFAKYAVLDALEKGINSPSVVTALDSSSAVKDVVVEAGGLLHYTKIGSPVVARVMMKTGAVFGGEGNGGAIFSDLHYFRDGAMSVVRMLEIMSKTGKKLSELAAEIPVYYQAKDSVDYSSLLGGEGVESMSGIKLRFMEEMERSTEKGFQLSFTITERNTLDGIKLFVESPPGEKCNNWVIIRPSGTEPIIRVASEACDRETAEKLVAETRDLVMSVMQRL